MDNAVLTFNEHTVEKFPMKMRHLSLNVKKTYFQVMSEIGDLVDHIDEIMGEVEEELLKRDQVKILPTFYKQLLRVQVPNAQKNCLT